MLNKAMIIGNVVREPEIRTTPSGQNVATFSVATNARWTDASGQKQEKVEFHNIVAWRKLADICAQYLHKGLKVYVEGKLQTRDWVTPDGIKHYKTEIVAENMEMLGSKSTGGSGPAGGSDAGFNQEPPIVEREAGGEEEIKIENIPF